MRKPEQGLYVIEIGLAYGREKAVRWIPWDGTSSYRTAREKLAEALKHDGPGSHRIRIYVPAADERRTPRAKEKR